MRTATKARRPRPTRSSQSAPPRTIPGNSDRAARIYKSLVREYPDATCALHHKDAFQLLIATILSAQCTDVRVNMVTPALFAKYPTPRDFAQAPTADLEQAIRSTGFYRNKAKSIQGTSRMIIEQFAGRVPDAMDDLLKLPGVARKTANVVLGTAFGKNDGVVVDTHVSRLAVRMGLTRQTTPPKIELDLMAQFPRKNWTLLSHLLIHHGRRICSARKPLCEKCVVARDCPKVGVKK